MDYRKYLLLFLLATGTLFIYSCQKEQISPNVVTLGGNDPGNALQKGQMAEDMEGTLNKRNQDSGKGGGGKGKNKDSGDGDGSDETSDPFVISYKIHQVDDPGELYMFSISESGNLMLLQSDSTVAMWGSDFWGTWKDPFTFADGKVEYVNGLTYNIFEFKKISSTQYDVYNTLIRSSYNSSHVDTTYSHPGIFQLIN